MATPYCSKDQWAFRKGGYANFAAYTTAKGAFPNADALQEILEDATNIMNDEDHIASLTTNITDTDYTERLERLCYNMANRMLAVEGLIASQGGNLGYQTWSPQDFMYTRERNILISLGRTKGYRVYGKVG